MKADSGRVDYLARIRPHRRAGLASGSERVFPMTAVLHFSLPRPATLGLFAVPNQTGAWLSGQACLHRWNSGSLGLFDVSWQSWLGVMVS